MNTKILSKPSPIKSGTYKTSTKLFFTPSKLLAAQITELFDNVWPQVTAMKNLRWQVRGYYEENQIGINEGLSRKFVEPVDKTNRPNLYRTCIQQDWEEQEYFIAKNLLVQIFACYEAWCDNILKVLHRNAYNEGKKLQFPGEVTILLSLMKIGASHEVKDAFYDIYVRNSKLHAPQCLDNWLTIYRYFKESRNCIMHEGGIANQRVVDAYTTASTLTKESLRVEEVPMMCVPVLGEYMDLSLRGVVGFSQVVLRIVETLDIEMIQCKYADEYFINRIKEECSKDTTSEEKKLRKIMSIVQKGRFVKPENPGILLPIFLNADVFSVR